MIFNDGRDDSESDRDYKAENRRLFLLTDISGISGGGQAKLKKITTRYSMLRGDEEESLGKSDSVHPAFAFFKKMCAWLGLNVCSTSKDNVTNRIACHDKVFRAAWRVHLPKEDFAMLLLTKHSFTDKIRSLLPELVFTDNTSDAGSRLIKSAVQSYNDALQHMINEHSSTIDDNLRDTERRITQADADSLRITLNTPIDLNRIPVIPDREREMEKRVEEREEEQRAREQEEKERRERDREEARQAAERRRQYRQSRGGVETQNTEGSDQESEFDMSCVAGSVSTAITQRMGSGSAAAHDSSRSRGIRRRRAQ